MITLYTQLEIALTLLRSFLPPNFSIVLVTSKLHGFKSKKMFHVSRRKLKASADFYYKGISLKGTDSQKLVVVIIDHKLNFE